MKKLLSLLLVLSLCLSSVILLASCTGKSAYEIAVENGFEGDEKAWLESLKGPAGTAGDAGKDGKDGQDGADGLGGTTGDSAYEVAVKNGFKGDVKAWLESLYGRNAENGNSPKIEVSENGYWIVDGQRLPYKVDGSNVALPTKIELVQTTYSVVKGNMTLPTVEIKVELDDGTTETLPVAANSLKDVDFTKEGEYPVTLTYAGVSTEATIKVEGLMVIYEDFNALSNTATMEEILMELGWKVPYAVAGQGNAGASSKENAADNLASILANANLDAITLPGALHRPNYVAVFAEDGRLLIDNHRYNLGVLTGATAFDGSLIVADSAYMKACYADSFTIQYDMEFVVKDEKSAVTVEGAEEPKYAGGNMYMGVYYGNDGNSTIPYHIGYHVSYSKSLQPRIRMGNPSTGKNSWKQADSINMIELLFTGAETTPPENLRGQKLTFKMVFVNDETDPNYGLSVYIKVAGGEFVLASSMASEGMETMLKTYTDLRTNEKYQGDTWQMLDIHMATNAMFYFDNFAVWTGVGEMPVNTSTSLYEELITPAA